MTKPILRLENVGFQYNASKNIISDLSLEINAGEYVVILGSNGSGKSTLAKLMAGLLQPSSGQVFIRGISTVSQSKQKEIRENISLVLQNPENQIIATIVEEDVALGPENLGFCPEEVSQRVAEALAKVGMGRYSQEDVAFLSGGQKQRVAIAGILAMQAKCIIFDESTAMLDPQGRSQIRKIVQELNCKEGLTVVWFTHLVEELMENHRLVVLDKGKVILDGKAREVLSQEVDLENLGLAPPLTIRLLNKLKKRGIRLQGFPFNIDELVELICQLKSKV